MPVSPSDLRARNTAVLLDQIWSSGELSRADLARRSGLARSTVSAIINPLVDAEVLRVVRIGRSQGGRPPEVLRLAEQRFHLVGAELGAAHVSVLVTDLRGTVKHWRSTEHPVETDPVGTMALLHDYIEGAVADARIDPQSVLGAGIAVPCPVHPDDPDRLSPQILPSWRNVRVRQQLADRHGWPVFVDNDANMGALAERWWGAGKDCASFAFIKVATGVGAGLVIDGHLYRGPGGIAGEIGHTAIDASGPHCRCGLHGCLEAMIGSRSLERRAAEALAADPDPALGQHPTVTALVSAAQAGQPMAADIIGTAGSHLGVAIANLVNLVNPTRVVLGGRLPHAGDVLLMPLRRALRERAMWTSVLEAEVVVSQLSERAIALGAATSVLQAAMADPYHFFKPTSSPRSRQQPGHLTQLT